MIMDKIPRYIIILILSGISTFGFGQTTGKWAQCTGEAVIQNITTEEAQIIAKRKARLDAIERVCGVNLQAETFVKDFMLAGDFIHSIAYGQVVEERNHTWTTRELPPENPSDPPIIILHLVMDAKVVPVHQKPDPYFRVSLDLNREVYQSGDEVILKIKSTSDCYLTVINLASNDSVYILIPNRFQEDCYLKAGSEIEIPDQTSRESGFRIRAANLKGHKQDTEIVKVIATKQRLTLLGEVEKSGGFGVMSTPKIAVTKLACWLSEIPIVERAEATKLYTIHSKE